ncbi:hypothetical protein CSB69_3338 [Morganella morganii]|nr:hypothetical protein CSB69_3338 [Morganella morganii]
MIKKGRNLPPFCIDEVNQKSIVANNTIITSAATAVDKPYFRSVSILISKIAA